MSLLTKVTMLCGVASSCLVMTAPAMAQTARTQAASQKSDVSDEEIVVSGTRIVRDGYDAPTPTTVIGAELLETNAPATLGDVIQTLPAFRNVATTGTANQSVSGTGGQTFANLRGLGATRTLVLVNGQRLVPSTGSGTIDLGVLPSQLLQRVDVVTGGASAVWGSDAVSGVVNFVFDTRFKGVRGLAEGGVSERGDYGSQKLALTWGGSLTDRLHLVASAEYYSNEGVPPRSRPWSDGGTVWNDIPNPAFVPGGSQPQFLRGSNYYFPATNFTGVIVGSRTAAGTPSTALAGTQFLPGGGTSTFSFCNEQGIAGLCSTPRDLPHFNYFTFMSTPIERGAGYARLTYDVAPDVSVYADALYGRSQTDTNTAFPLTTLLGSLTIPIDNAYLPTSVRDQMASLGLSAILLSRGFRDYPMAVIQRDTETKSFSAGVDAGLGSWKLKAYGSYGETRFLNEIRDVLKVANFFAAVDAVRAPSGAIVCRSTLTAPGNGCVPLNPFGDGSSSPEAIAYTTGDIRSDLQLSQLALGATLNGEPFETWAGPVSVALGAEYREQDADQTVDPLSKARGYMLLNPQPFSGKLNVKEVFAEVVVPLARDLPFVHSLDLNGAVRYTDYSTSGDVVAWKAGANWSPVDALTIRATRSRDIRAPNLLELFQSPTQQTAQVRDPRTNAAVVFQSLIGGNPALKAETADTIAVGAVYKPEWLSGFAMSLDYYDIKINDAISTLGGQDIVNRCEAGTTSFCPLVTRNAAGVITGIDLRPLNFQTVKTSGFDGEVSYRTGLGDAGSLSLRALVNYLRHYSINDGVATIDIAGSIFDSLPKWSWTLSSQYQNGPFTWSIVADHIGSGSYNPRFTFNDNSVKGIWYVDTTLEFALLSGPRGNASIYLNATNLFDQEPPQGFGFVNGPYDRVGRTYKAGMRFRF